MENNELEWKVNQALDSLDGMQRATANPFLYTRVKAAIDEQNSTWSRVAGMFGRPAYAMTIATLFVGINLWVATHRSHQEPVANSLSEGEQAFAAELATVNYNLSDYNSNDK